MKVALRLPLALFDEISEKVPHICNMSPAGPHHLEDLFEAGGVLWDHERTLQEESDQQEVSERDRRQSWVIS
ncbi:MAG: dihydroxy-acid dehydratase [Desulfobacterales bacterium]|nr:dihydroxy-acid dehydratase [Desulfobacterales bacterium]